MATKTQYLAFFIHLTDAAQVAMLQTGVVPAGHSGSEVVGVAQGAVLMAPDAASTRWAGPILFKSDPFVAPSITSEWFKGATDSFPRNVAEFTRKEGGWFGWHWLFGDTVTYKWRGTFVYAPPAVASVSAPVTIAPRRWIDGFEFPVTGEGGGGSLSGECTSRGASRHPDGFGLAIRANTSVRSHIPNEQIGGALPAWSWERFYVRLQQAPTVAAVFWRCRATTAANEGLAFAITPSGQIAVYRIDNINTFVLMATTAALQLNEWARLDLIVRFGTLLAGQVTLTLWVNGTVVLALTHPAGGMATGGRLHGSSEMGSTDTSTLALDVDDWICADAPNVTDGLDFQNGSRVQPVVVTGFGAGLTSWAGDWRTLLQNPVAGAATSLSTAAAGATLEITTDADLSLDAQPDGIGIVALCVVLNAGSVTTGSTLGLTSPALSLAPKSLAVASGWQQALWQIAPTATTALRPIAPLKLIHVKGAAGAATVTCFAAVAEVLGCFGQEDIPHTTPPPSPLPPHLGPHNAPYPRTPWARLTKPPLQPVFIRGNTYVGTGLGQDLSFPVPVHFVWIRPVTGDTGGTKWWSSLLGPHKGHITRPIPNLLPQACVDPTWVPGAVPDVPTADPPYPATVDEAIDQANDLAYGTAKHLHNGYWDALYLADPAYTFSRMLGNGAGGADIALYGRYATVPSPWHGVAQQAQYLLRLVGTDTQNNAAGVTYSYLAVGDPGMRFLLNGVLTNPRGAADQVTTLVHPKYTPQAVFLFPENPSDAATVVLVYKGPGHASASLSGLTGAEAANYLTIGLAKLTSKSNMHTLAAGPQCGFSAWRTDDTSGHNGAVVQLFSYVGDGAASRVIPLTPTSGKSPLWALIVPHNAAAIMRDPTHTGTTSTQLEGAPLAATGITAGSIDQITVGSACNANGVVHDVFVIPGAANPGQWSPPGDFMPVPPEPPPDAPTPTDPDEPPPTTIPTFPTPPTVPGVDPLPPTGTMPDLADDLTAECKPATTRIVNLALTRLGIDLVIVDLATESSKEAGLMRLVYTDAVQQTLRDVPWPFATRYVRLIPVSDPAVAVNSDWLYSYRQPVDCLFERRLVVRREGAVDPESPPFQLSSDSEGGLLFTNQPNAVLEYTCRPACPHTRSEALFRDAVAWKLAAAAGPGLSRMTEIVAHCQAQYAGTLDQARAILRPGNAGELAATPTVDTSAAAQAANVQVVNHALVRIGARTIRNLTTDQTREAQAARLIFEEELRAVLRDFPWPFATGYASLTLIGGTATVPVNGDWQYSYRLPTDLVHARRVVSNLRRAYDPHPPPFRLGQDATGGLVFTDLAATTALPVVLEYTRRLEGTVAIADVLFRDAFAWRLAAALAPSCARGVPEAAEQVGRGPEDGKQPRERFATLEMLRARATQYAEAQYQRALIKAEVAAANEVQADVTPPDADWITGRN